MRLTHIDFPPVMNASGAQNFFGEGYPFHRWWKYAGLAFRNCGFVAKTTTMEARLAPEQGKGNMPMEEDGTTPKECIPACIVVRPVTGVVLNAVGLSGPGAPALLAANRWQCRREHFFLSFMSVQSSASDRLAELTEFVQLLQSENIRWWNADAGLEMNFSCPNIGLHAATLIHEIGAALNCAAQLRIPLQVKLNALVPVHAACTIAKHEACAAITMGNTIPWGMFNHRIEWEKLFGSLTSPLAHLGGGGLSGWPLRTIHCDWIAEARDSRLRKPIWACGGIDSVAAVTQVAAAGASGIQLGTVAMLRPHRMRHIIRTAHEVFGN